MDFQHTLTLICLSCHKHQKFQASASQLICPTCGWKGAFRLPVTPPKKAAKNKKNPRRSFNERMRDITIQKTGRGLVISWHTFSWRITLLALAVLAWGSLFPFLYRLIYENPGNPNFLVYLVFYLLIWVGLGYSALALIIDRVELVIDRKNMSRHHHPLPFLGEFEMPLEYFKLFYAEGLTDQTISNPTANKKPQKSERAEMLLHARANSYRMVAVLLSEREIPLFSHFSRPEIVYFLQEQISGWVNENRK